MRITSLAAAVAAAAALLSPAASHAAGAEPCEDGYVGVIAYDEDGEVARVCVREPDLPQELVDRVVRYPGALAAWAGDAVPECEDTPNGIRCETIPPPPRP